MSESFFACLDWVLFALILVFTYWIGYAQGRKGHPYNQKRANDWHKPALEKSELKPFEPYCLRHTALTRLAKTCRNPYAVAAIAE